jgi:hypothetical protein
VPSAVGHGSCQQVARCVETGSVSSLRAADEREGVYGKQEGPRWATASGKSRIS